MLQQLTDANFKAEAIEKGGIALVDFSAVWCGPCRALAPQVQMLADEYADRCRFYGVDIDTAADTASEYGIMSVPTIIIFKDGQPVEKSMGLKSKAQLAKILDGVLG